MITVADTSPLRYPLLIGEIHFLPTLFGSVAIPTAAARHLGSPYVREVLLLTLGAWYQNDRLTALAAADRRFLRAAGAAAGAIPDSPPLPAPPWGHWVAVLPW